MWPSARQLHYGHILHAMSGILAQGVGDCGAVGLGVTRLRHDHEAYGADQAHDTFAR